MYVFSPVRCPHLCHNHHSSQLVLSPSARTQLQQHQQGTDGLGENRPDVLFLQLPFPKIAKMTILKSYFSGFNEMYVKSDKTFELRQSSVLQLVTIK